MHTAYTLSALAAVALLAQGTTASPVLRQRQATVIRSGSSTVTSPLSAATSVGSVSNTTSPVASGPRATVPASVPAPVLAPHQDEMDATAFLVYNAAGETYVAPELKAGITEKVTNF